jgi:hypothetical protein
MASDSFRQLSSGAVTQQSCETALSVYKDKLFSLPGVTGVGVGLKRDSNNHILRPFQYCIIVYLQSDKYLSSIPNFLSVQDSLSIPHTLNIPVCIDIIGNITPY